ncbi:hypothetical protein FHX81_1249 [Saccharothrix saharensis]|uniref:SdrD B-like protein n=2 Tax=Saccharothrix saharensis TaxID=571190 RepID=A0A543J823_9PSEU|nr:hypothetical protein FHX81_1249 [Saccharothrix saharensis]
MACTARSLSALLSAAALCIGVSVGPAYGDGATSSEPTATTTARPTTAEIQPTETETTTSAPAKTTDPTTGSATTTEPAGTTGPTPAEPSASEPDPRAVDLRLETWFEKDGYFLDEEVIVHARVTNVGTTTANPVWVGSTGESLHHYWTGFGQGAGPVEPGQAVEGKLTSHIIGIVDLLTIEVSTGATDQDDANPADNIATITAPVTVVRGDYSGTFYGDRNVNGVMEPHEALAGLELSISSVERNYRYRTTTDEAGRFAFRDVPRSTYRTFIDLEGWQFRLPDVEVGRGVDPDVLIRGEYLPDRVLTATAAFDRPTYGIGDTAVLSLGLTNGGRGTVPNITAIAVAYGQVPVDLGKFDQYGPGVTLLPGETGRVDVHIPVDDRVADLGTIKVTVTFGSPPFGSGSVQASAIARVPGRRLAVVQGTLGLPWSYTGLGVGVLGPPPYGRVVPDTKVYLRDQATGAVSFRDTTDRFGKFEFFDVQVGLYTVGVVGPWRIVGSTDFSVPSNSYWYPYSVLVVPGPVQPDPDDQPQTTTPQGGVPPATARTTPPTSNDPEQELAATGVGATWLALGGLLTLVTGAGFVTGARRRRT